MESLSCIPSSHFDQKSFQFMSDGVVLTSPIATDGFFVKKFMKIAKLCCISSNGLQKSIPRPPKPQKSGIT